MGAAWEANLEGGDVTDIVGKILPRDISDGSLVWSRDLGAHIDNNLEDQGRECDLLKTGQT